MAGSKKKWLRLLAIGALAASLGLAGCSGSDGNDGATGATGPTGPTGEQGTPGQDANAVLKPESCAVCHGDVAGQHEQTVVKSSDIIGTLVSGNLQIDFWVKANNVPTSAYTALYRAYNHYVDPASTGVLTKNKRETITTTVTFTNNGNGTYRVVVPAASVRNNSTYLIALDDGNGGHPTAVYKYGNAAAPTGPERDLVSNDACKSCHGDYPALGFGHYAVGGADCQICHSIDSRSVEIYGQASNGTWSNQGVSVTGTNLVEYIHGIHNSEAMPAGKYVRSLSSGQPSTAEGGSYAIGYPSDMRTCKTCHSTPAQLAAATTAPVSFYLCMSCHQTWDGFKDHNGDPLAQLAAGTTLGDDHRALNGTANCMAEACHASSINFDEAGDFHNYWDAADSHYDSFYRGEDISFKNPNTVGFRVTEVTKTGNNVSFKWKASKNGVDVDPCNTNILNGPTFQGLGAYLSYAKGDDWVNEGVSSTSPGQPASARNLFTSLTTTCDNTSKTATSVGLSVNTTAAAYASKALLSLGGKAIDKYAPTGDNFFVRVASPTFAFSMSSAAAQATETGKRRDIVDNAKCTGCHQGTMYQHGGDRVDNAQLCVICHNPASNDKSNRVTTFQIVNPDGTVDTNSTYDGKTAQTYDLRYLLHSIHGVGFSETPYVIYRSRGIYAFVAEGTAKPTGWPEDGMTIYGSDNNKTIAHNWTVIDYPKPANDCEACHYEGTYEAPDQTKAVAVTMDAGTSWSSQADDIVTGPTAAACMPCHQGWAPARSHATDFGYTGVITKDAMLELSE